MQATNFPQHFQGIWEGHGTVHLSDREVPYSENLEIKMLKSEPVFVFNVQSFTKHAEKGHPMHAENGFIKLKPHGAAGDMHFMAEAQYSHPFGLNEFETGQYKDGEMTLATQGPHHF